MRCSAGGSKRSHLFAQTGYDEIAEYLDETFRENRGLRFTTHPFHTGAAASSIAGPVRGIRHHFGFVSCGWMHHVEGGTGIAQGRRHIPRQVAGRTLDVRVVPNVAKSGTERHGRRGQ